MLIVSNRVSYNGSEACTGLKQRNIVKRESKEIDKNIFYLFIKNGFLKTGIRPA